MISAAQHTSQTVRQKHVVARCDRGRDGASILAMSPAQSLHRAFAAAIGATTADTVIVARELRRDVAERTRDLVDVLRDEGLAPEATVLEVKRIARFAGANPEYHATIVGDAVTAAIAAYFR